MRIVLYGGSFNPPHLGHRAAAQTLLEQLAPDRLLVMPNRLPPHKALPADSPAADDRLELCRLCFADLPSLAVSDLELRREGASYTADTVEQLRAEHPQDELILALGTDMLLCFDRWYRFRYLAEQCSLAVFCRSEGEREAIEHMAEQLRYSCGARVLLLRHEPIAVSSAQLRELLPRRQGREFFSETVYAELIRRRYYGAQPELVWLREQAYAMLKPKRIAHVAGCEGEAVALAMRWGEDPELAAEAAILHDITKSLKAEEQLALCEQYGLQMDPSERNTPEVLHAITAAAYAADHFGVCRAVQNAIRWHCTGKPDMSLLEKIVWLADFTEPNRSFPGVDAVRALTKKDLDLAMAKALDMSLQNIKNRDYDLCTITVQARDYYAELTDRR